MLEESIDPRPNFELALALLLEPGSSQAVALSMLNLSRFWDDRQNDWTNLRNMQYWLEHAR